MADRERAYQNWRKISNERLAAQQAGQFSPWLWLKQKAASVPLGILERREGVASWDNPDTAARLKAFEEAQNAIDAGKAVPESWQYLRPR